MSRHSELLREFLAVAPMPAIVAAAVEHEDAVLCVGGAVRDALLGRPAADIDLAVAGDLEAFIGVFARHCGRRPGAIGDRWRDTHRVIVDGTQVDIGRMLGDEAEDLAERDFTVNAMAVKLFPAAMEAPALIDLHGGVRDLERRTLRMVSAESMRRDPLRMLRGLRYTATLEGFEIENATEAEIVTGSGSLTDVAAERVQTEWRLLLAGPRWWGAVQRCIRLGLDEICLGFRLRVADGRAWSEFEDAVPDEVEWPDELATLRLAALCAARTADESESVRRALVERRWPAAAAACVSRVGGWARRVGEASAEELVDWALADANAAASAALVARGLAVDNSVEHAAERLETFVRRAREPRWVRGSDLRGWGMDPGPDLGRLLHRAACGQLTRRWGSAEESRAWARDHLIPGKEVSDG